MRRDSEITSSSDLYPGRRLHISDNNVNVERQCHRRRLLSAQRRIIFNMAGNHFHKPRINFCNDQHPSQYLCTTTLCLQSISWLIYTLRTELITTDRRNDLWTCSRRFKRLKEGRCSTDEANWTRFRRQWIKPISTRRKYGSRRTISFRRRLCSDVVYERYSTATSAFKTDRSQKCLALGHLPKRPPVCEDLYKKRQKMIT